MKITERAWRLEREIGLDRYAADRAYADHHGYPTHEWTGADRAGRPLLVAWVANPSNGNVLSAYEITDT